MQGPCYRAFVRFQYFLTAGLVGSPALFPANPALAKAQPFGPKATNESEGHYSYEYITYDGQTAPPRNSRDPKAPKDRPRDDE